MLMKNKISLYQYGYNYLLHYVTKEVLERHLISWSKPKNINEVFLKLIHHAQNKSMYANTINAPEHMREFKAMFEGFDPKLTLDKYKSSYGILNGFGKMKDDTNITKPDSVWARYSKSIFDAANYLLTFNNIDIFNEHIDELYENSEMGIAAPIEISVSGGLNSVTKKSPDFGILLIT